MTDLLKSLIQDWQNEAADLEAVVQNRTEEEWNRETPAKGWTVKHQIRHLNWTDEMYCLAITKPEEFQAQVEKLKVPGNTIVDDGAAHRTDIPGTEILNEWRASRARLEELLLGLEKGARIPWIATSMGAASAATARLMETFAHAQDVKDTFGVETVPTERLKQIAHLAIRALPHNFKTNGLPVPQEPIFVELTFGDERWTWNDPEASQKVSGPALDFVQLAVRRRHLDDGALQVHGEDAAQWLDIVQAYAGKRGEDRKPLSQQ